MEDMSGMVMGLVSRFQMVHFVTNLTSILSEKCKAIAEARMTRFVTDFTMCLVYQLCHETELYIDAGIVLPRSVKTFSRLTSSTRILNYKGHICRIYKGYYSSISDLNFEDVLMCSSFL